MDDSVAFTHIFAHRRECLAYCTVWSLFKLKLCLSIIIKLEIHSMCEYEVIYAVIYGTFLLLLNLLMCPMLCRPICLKKKNVGVPILCRTRIHVKCLYPCFLGYFHQTTSKSVLSGELFDLRFMLFVRGLLVAL